MQRIDLRSDTVTLPTPAMREAMATAEVGDDVYGEDPSVRRLEERAAELLGKEAALFFPSGTMANQAALRVLVRPGDVVLASRDCHVLRYESGAAAALSGVEIRTLGSEGRFGASDVLGALPPDDPHFAPVTTLAVENTHNDAGGRIFPFEDLLAVTRAARDLGLHLHMDGARLWNAVAASGVPADAWAEPFDTVAFCLSKGLGAPVGSLVCCRRELRPALLRARKMLGGAMRQAGVLAAAGLHALEHHRERLAEDHAHAALLAKGLGELGLHVERDPETNIVMFHPPRPAEFWRRAWEKEVRFNPPSAGRVRAVTHMDVDGSAIGEALERLRSCVS